MGTSNGGTTSMMKNDVDRSQQPPAVLLSRDAFSLPEFQLKDLEVFELLLVEIAEMNPALDLRTITDEQNWNSIFTLNFRMLLIQDLSRRLMAKGRPELSARGAGILHKSKDLRKPPMGFTEFVRQTLELRANRGNKGASLLLSSASCHRSPSTALINKNGFVPDVKSVQPTSAAAAAAAAPPTAAVMPTSNSCYATTQLASSTPQQ